VINSGTGNAAFTEHRQQIRRSRKCAAGGRGVALRSRLRLRGRVVDGSMTLELELLAELRAALTEYEVTSHVHEEFTALAVATGTPGVFVWVFIHGGRYFSWNRADLQHPVKDLPGAARRIADQVNTAGVDSGADSRRGHGTIPRIHRCVAHSTPEASSDV
jgi:hypothetical protein